MLRRFLLIMALLIWLYATILVVKAESAAPRTNCYPSYTLKGGKEVVVKKCKFEVKRKAL